MVEVLIVFATFMSLWMNSKRQFCCCCCCCKCQEVGPIWFHNPASYWPRFLILLNLLKLGCKNHTWLWLPIVLFFKACCIDHRSKFPLVHKWLKSNMDFKTRFNFLDNYAPLNLNWMSIRAEINDWKAIWILPNKI